MHTQTHMHFMLNLNIKLCNEQMCWRPLQLAEQEVRVQSWGRVDPLEKEMATLSSILAWRIPWTEEPDWLQSMGSETSQTQLFTLPHVFILYKGLCSCVLYYTLRMEWGFLG